MDKHGHQGTVPQTLFPENQDVSKLNFDFIDKR